jgi:hypothetical protein
MFIDQRVPTMTDIILLFEITASLGLSVMALYIFVIICEKLFL